MKIGELSTRSGVSIRMLRYYEAEDLLKPRRTESGYRMYSALDEQTVERIKLLSAAGMTLATIRQFAPCIRGEGPVFEPCDELRTTLRDQLHSIDRKADKLLDERRMVERFMRELDA